MRARVFANQLVEAVTALRLVGASEPRVVVRSGRTGAERPVTAVKVRKAPDGQGVVVMETEGDET